MVVKLLWNLGTLILLRNFFHEKPKSKYFFFLNMRGMWEGEKECVTHFVVAVVFLCPEVFWGEERSFVVVCFVFLQWHFVVPRLSLE